LDERLLHGGGFFHSSIASFASHRLPGAWKVKLSVKMRGIIIGDRI